MIGPTQVLSAVVPEDPLYCRVEEMALKYLNVLPETIIGALDEEMGKLQGSVDQEGVKIDTTELTAADKCFQRGVKLADDDVQSQLCMNVKSLLLSTEVVKI